MAIRTNVDLATAVEIINARYDANLNCYLGEIVIIHPDEEPVTHLMLTRHAMNVRVNEKVELGGAFMEVIPQWLVPAVEAREKAGD